MAGKDVLSNFLRYCKILFRSPLQYRNWIRSLTGNIEGTVRRNRLAVRELTFDHRRCTCLIPSFSSISVENPGRMTNKSNKTVIGLRYEDADKIGLIVDAIRNMLQAHRDDIGEIRNELLVYFNGVADSSLNIMVYCFAKQQYGRELACRTAGCLPENYLPAIVGKTALTSPSSQTLYIDDPEAAPRYKIKR